MCEASWGDGFCVAACNTAACGYDGGMRHLKLRGVSGRRHVRRGVQRRVGGFDGGDCDVDAGIHGVAWR